MFGTLGDWWSHLEEWVTPLNLRETSTFVDEEQTPRTVYCAGITSYHEEGVGLILWNEAPYGQGGVAYVSEDGVVGAITAQSQSLPAGSIPGWPSYAWFIPDRSILVTLVPDNLGGARNNGIKQIRDYLVEYLRTLSPYVVLGEPIQQEGGMEYPIEGYRANSEAEPSKDLKSYINTRPLYLPGLIDTIRDRHQEINKLVRSTTINYSVPDQRGVVDSLLQAFGLTERSEPPTDEVIKYRIEVDWTPANLQELNNVIENRRTVENVKDKWGVRFAKESNKIYWFETEDAKRQLSLTRGLQQKRLWDIDDLRLAWGEVQQDVSALLETAT